MNFNVDTDINESRFDDIVVYQEITDEGTIHELMGDPIILDRYKNNFDYLYERTVDIAVLCWNNKNDHGMKLQHTLIQFKVNDDDEMTLALPLNRFMISLVFIKTILPFINDVKIEDFILTDFMSLKIREKIQKNIVDVLMQNGLIIDEIQEIMADMSLDLKELLLVFSKADMQVFTAENLFLDHYRVSPLIREINNTEYPPDMQITDIVEENQKKYKILEAEMLRLGNPFFIDNKYTGIIKPKQMEELYINFSQVPDGRELVPVIMNGNGFKAGYHDMDVLYAGAIAARVPDMMNEDLMGLAGYFSRNLMILTYGTISKTVYDCGSVNPIPIKVNDVVLDMMDGRYYYESKNSGILKVLHKNDKHLVGRELWFRSPCTCNLNEDCCHVCYGSKALKVGELEGGFIYTTELMTSNVSQNVLSTKHLLKANAKKIKYSDNFDDYFISESSTVVVDNEKRFDIYLRDDYQDNMDETFTIYIGKDLKPVTISDYTSIIISEKITEKMKEVVIDDQTYLKISSSKVLDVTDGVFCTIIPVNIMMTQKYMNIMKLFETEVSKISKIEDAVTILMNLLYGVIPILSTHGEIILGKLMRQVDSNMLRPNFLEPDVPYKLIRLKAALENTESVTTALSFEKPKKHILGAIFNERNDINRVGVRSFTDYLYGEETK